jgi:hypothetical protein
MSRYLRHPSRRLSRAAAGCLLAGGLAIQLGPTTTSQAVDRINAMSMRPLPSVAPRPVVRDSMVWVPARVVPVPGEPTGVTVHGHWERRLPATHEVHVPPLTIVRPSTGAIETVPAGIRPPVEQRLNSP